VTGTYIVQFNIDGLWITAAKVIKFLKKA